MRKITIIVIIIIGLALLCIASDSVAQTSESPGKFYVGFSAGLSRGSTTVGGENNSTNGLLFSGIAGFGKDSKPRWLLEVLIQPYKVKNPVREESFSGVYVLPSLQFYAGNYLYFRTGIGIYYSSWSGSNVWVNSATDGAFGLSVGVKKYSFGSMSVRPEVIARFCTNMEDWSTSLYGLQVVFAWNK